MTRLHRIDVRRAPRGQVAGECRDHGDQRDGGGDRERVARGQPIQDGLHESARPQRGGETQRDTDANEQHRLGHHHADDGAALRAERHADADLVGPTRDVIAHEAEQADTREHQRQRAERGVRRGKQPLVCKPQRDLLALRREPLDRQRRIDLAHRGPHRLGHRQRIAHGPENDVQAPRRPLQRAPIHCRRTGIAHARVLRIAHHADDLKFIGLLERPADAPAQDIPVREQLSRRRLIDDRHLERLDVIVIVETPTPQDVNTHRREERRRDVHHVHLFFRRGLRGLPLLPHRPRQRRRPHAGQRRHPLEDLAEDLRRALDVVAIDARIHVEHEQVRRIEPDIHALQVVERPQKQAGADEQNERHRNLRHEQRFAEHAAGAGDAAAGLLECPGQIHVCRAQRGQEAENHPRQHADARDEPENPPVEWRVLAERQQRARPVPDEHAERAAQAREQQAFGEQLPGQPAACRAHRKAHRNLAVPRRRARQQQIRDIGTDDQEDDDDNDAEKPGRPLRLGIKFVIPVSGRLDQELWHGVALTVEREILLVGSQRRLVLGHSRLRRSGRPS